MAPWVGYWLSPDRSAPGLNAACDPLLHFLPSSSRLALVTGEVSVSCRQMETLCFFYILFAMLSSIHDVLPQFTSRFGHMSHISTQSAAAFFLCCFLLWANRGHFFVILRTNLKSVQTRAPFRRGPIGCILG